VTEFETVPLWRALLLGQVARDPDTGEWPGWPYVRIDGGLLRRFRVWREVRRATKDD
jgi:hypothetical protein